MAEGASTDLMMSFELDGQPVWAESNLGIDDQDLKGGGLMKEFIASPDYTTYTNYFEVSGFGINMKLDSSDGKPAASNGQGRSPAAHPAGAASTAGAAGTAASGLSFSRWYKFKPEDFKKNPYPMAPISGSFDRMMDSASPLFFQCCCDRKTFNKAVLVKRVSQGDYTTGSSRKPAAYLRIEFKNVLITSVDWDDGEIVKEKCQFTCTGMKVTYRQQRDDGTVDASLGDKMAEWPNPNNKNQSAVLTRGR